jgi:hypothetical protein
MIAMLRLGRTISRVGASGQITYCRSGGYPLKPTEE